MILLEFSKLIYPLEKSVTKAFQYYFNIHLYNLPCLKKTMDEISVERWYFFLENQKFKIEIKHYLPKLYKVNIHLK